MSRFDRYLSKDACTGDYVFIVSRMLFDEPSVGACVRLLQQNCLRHGVLLRWGHSPPTPSFAAHIRDFWEPFCREAIVSFMAVGFAPFRLRRVGNNLVPEILPLGTYSWRIARPAQEQRKRPRYAAHGGRGAAPPMRPAPEYQTRMQAGALLDEGIDQSSEPMSQRLRDADTEPLLRYEVTCMHTDDFIHVYAFCQPHATFNCFSPLASLIPHYVSLLNQRERAARAEEWNCRPNFILQDAQKALINEAANAGTVVSRSAESDLWSLNYESSMRYQDTTHKQMESHKEETNFPKNGSILVAPKNSTAHTLDKADPPTEMGRRELHFCRCAAQALGVPPGVALQGSAAIGSSSTGSSGGGWHDGPEVVTRSMTDTCARINRALEALMAQAYQAIYGAVPDYRNPPPGTRRMPTFTIPVAPVLPLEHIIALFDAQLLDEESYSRLFEVSLGYPMAKEQALKARADRHRAANILPFKDKKDAPK